jgi:hypothetical protein
MGEKQSLSQHAWFSRLECLEMLDLTPEFHRDLKNFTNCQESIAKLLGTKQRKGVIYGFQNHTPMQRRAKSLFDKQREIAKRLEPWEAGYSEKAFQNNLAEARKGTKAIYENAIIPETKHVLVSSPSGLAGTHIVERRFILRGNGWLRVDVDITAGPPKLLAKRFHQILREVRQQRERERNVDCWDTYRKHKAGWSFLRIARHTSGETGSSNDNPHLKSACEQHRKAYKHADLKIKNFKYAQ